MFTRAAGAWSEQQALVTSDGAAGDEFGDDRILSCMHQHAGAGVGEVLECLVQTVKRFASDTVQSDDMTAVVVRYLGDS